MVEAHAHLNITNAEFDVVAKHLNAVLAELGVPASEGAAVAAIVESQRGEIVSGQLTSALS